MQQTSTKRVYGENDPVGIVQKIKFDHNTN